MKEYIDYEELDRKLHYMLKQAEYDKNGHAEAAIKVFIEIAKYLKRPLDKLK